MPTIASLGDLRAAQKEGLSTYAMHYALCSMQGRSGLFNGAPSPEASREEAP